VTQRRIQERSQATRAALLDAALDSLVERGYAATTTVEVARRAGVSRGAQLHHFPTKELLLTAAVERLFERRMGEFRKALADAAPGSGRIETAIDVLWSMYETPTFAAWVELWVGARTDPVLAAAVVAMNRRFVTESRAMFGELFPPEPGVPPGFYEMGRDFAFALMDGVALGRLVPHDHARPAAEFIEALKAFGRLAGRAAPLEET
jgi:AcrR family transcriptional regulator